MTSSEQVRAGEPTNEQIALMLRWEHIGAGDAHAWKDPAVARRDADGGTFHRMVPTVPDYLGSTGMLDEGIAFLKERGWLIEISNTWAERLSWRVNIYRANGLAAAMKGDGDTLNAAFYTALWRADRAETEAGG